MLIPLALVSGCGHRNDGNLPPIARADSVSGREYLDRIRIYALSDRLDDQDVYLPLLGLIVVGRRIFENLGLTITILAFDENTDSRFLGEVRAYQRTPERTLRSYSGADLHFPSFSPCVDTSAIRDVFGRHNVNHPTVVAPALPNRDHQNRLYPMTISYRLGRAFLTFSGIDGCYNSVTISHSE